MPFVCGTSACGTAARLLDAIARWDGKAAAELSRTHLLAMKERLR
jgi:DNA-binding FadR family transcriptional regulator